MSSLSVEQHYDSGLRHVDLGGKLVVETCLKVLKY